MNDCIFCKIAAEEIPVKKIYENKNWFSIPDAHPVGEGHSLVISKKHFENALDLPSTLGPELIDCMKNTAIKLMKKYDGDGFNIVNNNFESAGQVVKHIHFHVLPRKKGDNKRGIFIG